MLQVVLQINRNLHKMYIKKYYFFIEFKLSGTGFLILNIYPTTENTNTYLKNNAMTQPVRPQAIIFLGIISDIMFTRIYKIYC